MFADVAFPQTSDNQLGNIRLTRFRDLSELESGVYWPQLRPYFIKPYFRCLTYRLTDRGLTGKKQGQVLSMRAAGGLGDLDVAYVQDRFSTVMSISDPGLPDYCLTSVSRGGLSYLGPGSKLTGSSSETTGLIYRGLPGTHLSATHDHERLAIWIPARSLEQRLAALLGEPGMDDVAFAPLIDWESGPGQGIRRLIWLLTQELASPRSFATSDIACRSFTDLCFTHCFDPSRTTTRCGWPDRRIPPSPGVFAVRRNLSGLAPDSPSHCTKSRRRLAAAYAACSSGSGSSATRRLRRRYVRSGSRQYGKS